MARPARVRMRSRKPWVLARRRLFGWKVRLLTAGLALGVTGLDGPAVRFGLGAATGGDRGVQAVPSSGAGAGTDLTKVRTPREGVKHVAERHAAVAPTESPARLVGADHGC